ncbi:MAG: ABC transporter permease subunit [Lachnospiraceae bacterium]|nr:ABC transporter permease subunit [Lachnospiraceae bacterium]
MKPDLKNRIAKSALPAVFWLTVWQGAAAWVDQELLIPSPLAVLRQLGELAAMPLFWRSAGFSLLRIFCGALGGTALGILCAVLTCRSLWADRLLSPALRVIRSTPVASFIILLLLWFPPGRVPGIISGLMVLPVIWESVGAGIRNTPPELLEMCRVYHFGRRKTIRYVYIPAIRPHFASGVCNAIGLAWKSGVAAEVLCLPKASIGTQIYYSKIYLETPSLFAWTLVVILLSLLLEKLIRRILGVKGGDAA